jgi:hypothetical protein
MGATLSPLSYDRVAPIQQGSCPFGLLNGGDSIALCGCRRTPPTGDTTIALQPCLGLRGSAVVLPWGQFGGALWQSIKVDGITGHTATSRLLAHLEDLLLDKFGEDDPDIRRVVPQFSGERALTVVDGEISTGPGEQRHQDRFATVRQGTLQDLLETIAARGRLGWYGAMAVAPDVGIMRGLTVVVVG